MDSVSITNEDNLGMELMLEWECSYDDIDPSRDGSSQVSVGPGMETFGRRLPL